MSDFSRDRFEAFRRDVEDEIERMFAGLGLTAEAIGAFEARLQGRIVFQSGTAQVERPIDVQRLLVGDGEEESADGQVPYYEINSSVETTVDLEDAGRADEHRRIEALRYAVLSREDYEDAAITVRRAREFAAFLEEGTHG